MQGNEPGCVIKGCLSWKPTKTNLRVVSSNGATLQLELDLCAAHRALLVNPAVIELSARQRELKRKKGV